MNGIDDTTRLGRRSGRRRQVAAHRLALVSGLLGLMATAALGQEHRIDLPPDAQGQAKEAARFEQWKKALPPGSGPYKVVREEPASLPDHTIFRPASLSASRPAPLIVFANGGCRNTPIEFTAFLTELASHGYFIIAAGTDAVEFATADFGGLSANGKPLQVVSRSALTDATDWATQETNRAGGRFFHRIDAAKLAYMGQSCGGMQALSASTDARTTTTVVLNSGRFSPTMMGSGRVPKNAKFPEWFEWDQLHAPIAYFSGGPTDIPTSHENFGEIKSLPVFLADLPVGHTGAYPEPDHRWSAAVLSWLDWKLRGNAKAGADFIGPDCGLCRNKDWTVTGSKNL